MAYTTAADLKTYLGITASTDDTLLTALIARAQKAIDMRCARIFEASGDTTRYFDAVRDTDGYYLYFDEDICAITTITNNLDNGTGGVIVTSSQYVTMPRNTTPYYGVELKSSAGISWDYTSDSQSAISVAGRWAYSTSAPADIVMACTRWAAYMYRQKDAQIFDVTAIPEAGIIQVPQGVPRDVDQMLMPYVKRV